MRSIELSALVLALSVVAGCSGMGTTMTKVGRLGQNTGYEIAAELPVVQQAAIDVMKARGYEVSVKADPESGAEGAGQIVIAQRTAKYEAQPQAQALTSTPKPAKELGLRDLVDIYLSKKWHMGDNLGVANITLVQVQGSSYLSKSPGGLEEETPRDKAFLDLVRDEIERKVALVRGAAPVK